MNGTTYDMLAATGTLREVGFDDRQTEAVAGADPEAGLAALEARLTAGGSIGVVTVALKLFG